MTMALTEMTKCVYANFENVSEDLRNVFETKTIPIITALGILFIGFCYRNCFFNKNAKSLGNRKILNLTEEQGDILISKGGQFHNSFYGMPLLFCQEGATFNNGNVITIGGTNSSELRYPHLVLKLCSIKKKFKDVNDLDVLILGPGLSSEKGDPLLVSSQLHEILAAFSERIRVKVVDILPFVNTLEESVFGPNQRAAALSVVGKFREINFKNMSSEEINLIRNYLFEISNKIEQKMELKQEDFAKLDLDGKYYDFIFATQSLVYSIGNASHEDSLKIINKYLAALKIHGRLVIDGPLYSILREKIKQFPCEKRLDKKSKEFKIAGYRFKAKRLVVPNRNTELNGVSFIKYDTKLYTNRISTDDIFFIKRL